ncbi:MAG: ParB/RepB/Spo0J family partition protein [Phycisphaerales bacterium]
MAEIIVQQATIRWEMRDQVANNNQVRSLSVLWVDCTLSATFSACKEALMSNDGGDRAPKMARKLGRGLGNLIPVPLPPKETSGGSLGRAASGDAAPSAPSAGVASVTRPLSASETQTNAARPLTGLAEAARPVAGTGSLATHVARTEAPSEDQGAVYRVVPIASIVRNPWQPREMFHEEQIRELAQSIESAGLMQPLVVRAKGKGFELIAGERRLRALTLLKRTQAPVVVHEVDDQVAAEWALIENLQREDLNAMERATAMQRLVSEFQLTHEELADRLGLKRATVTNLLSLNHLDAKSAALVRSGTLSAGHAKCLLSVDSIPERSRLAEACVKEGWPVRKLEQEAKRTRERSTGNTRLPATRNVSAHVADLERQLTDHLGTKVTIQMGRKPNTGRLVIQFYSNAQFDGLLQAMNYTNDGL